MTSEERVDVERSRRGDRDAFGRLIDRYAASICGFQHRLVGDFHEAQDLAQETFLRAYGALRRLDRAERFRSWLFRIAFHVAADYRRANRQSTLSLQAIEEDCGEVVASSASGAMVAGEGPGDRARAALDALYGLPENYALVAFLRFVERLSYREIAEALETSESCVKVRLHRARRLLKQRLAACEEPSG
ncbi:MAG: sigma-70 family RNA polymerase sigma factor [Planctomycetes bacterium]|nr:sigma-70 family RNA polymerase sigma factor [Planctomycetota bacterium]